MQFTNVGLRTQDTSAGTMIRLMPFAKPRTRAEIVSADPLGEYHVWWDDLTRGAITRFQRQLKRAKREQDLQSFLEREPMLLIQHLGGGHGRWVIPRQRLGAEHVTDFVIGDKCSYGFDWQAVELESPNARMFTRRGDPTSALIHAIRQIQDWRAWLTKNADYAGRARSQSGLGLMEIRPDLDGLILIGRRSSVDPATHQRRRQMAVDLKIEIHTYDFLLDNARARIPWVTQHRKALLQRSRSS